ncbi:MarC family protein [Candidatus Micrarchaeota archaeon]|nr:MarC family protein [Candidatus Micrarchaeota archaeon]
MFEGLFSLSSFISSFALLFAIMDPFASIPVFLSLTGKFSAENKMKAANQALIVASVVVAIFLFFGSPILQLFGISLSDFKIAGGGVLLILGAQLVFGWEKKEKATKDYQVAATIIGVPLITGPGVITSVIVLTATEGLFVTFLAAAASLFANWVILRNSYRLLSFFGGNSIEILSKVMGLLLIAVAVGFIRAGLLQ